MSVVYEVFYFNTNNGDNGVVKQFEKESYAKEFFDSISISSKRNGIDLSVFEVDKKTRIVTCKIR